jgi:DNA-binding LacI/PurR family transcriptional regulator
MADPFRILLMTEQTTIPKRRIRLADIAAEAGVSQVTVSKVLFPGGANNTRVAQLTAERIQSIAQRLGYTPNLSAKQLAGEKSRLIGIIIDSFAPEVAYKVLAYLERAAAVRGYRLIVGQLHDEVESVGIHLRDFIGRGVEGVVCLAHDYPSADGAVDRLYRPVENIVFVGPPRTAWADWVGADIAAGVRMLVRHLAETGRRKIALFLTDDTSWACRLRMRGLAGGLKASGLNPDDCPVWVMEDNPFGRIEPQAYGPAVYGSLERLLASHNVDALIAVNDLVAMYAIQYLASRGIRVPHEVAVAGFDNSAMAAAALPPITSVDQCAPRVAQEVMDMLLSPAGGSPRAVMIEPELVVRTSTAKKRKEPS